MFAKQGRTKVLHTGYKNHRVDFTLPVLAGGIRTQPVWRMLARPGRGVAVALMFALSLAIPFAAKAQTIEPLVR